MQSCGRRQAHIPRVRLAHSKVTTALKALSCNPPRPGPTLFAAPPRHWRNRVVLVVEDHACYRLLIACYLDTLGLAHEVVENAQLALDALERRHFDLLISDCQMPGMDGIALARAVRQRERGLGVARVPFIVLTAALDQERAARALAVDIDAWMSKPLTLQRLQPVLEHWLPGTDALTAGQALAAFEHGVDQPTRASLIQLFGSAEVVERLLSSLLEETAKDRAALALALVRRDPVQVLEHLHRLVGSMAFLGVPGLERQSVGLIGAVRRSGIAANRVSLERLLDDLEHCLDDLARI
ncbi:Hpt domain-containing protein [Pseudomonas sp. ok272]|nr:Hpt domain-containing protein [Pseudomonas sp. ok272]